MDSTALQRQNQRIKRLKEMGVDRATFLVHQDCIQALEGLRPHLVDPVRADALAALVEQLHDKKTPTNVAQVRHLSPSDLRAGDCLRKLTAECTPFLACVV